MEEIHRARYVERHMELPCALQAQVHHSPEIFTSPEAPWLSNFQRSHGYFLFETPLVLLLVYLLGLN